MARNRSDWNVARSQGMPVAPCGIAARKDSSFWIKDRARALRPAFTTAKGRWQVSNTSSRKRWPSLAGLPAKIPNAGRIPLGSLACELRNAAKGSPGATVSVMRFVPSGDPAFRSQRRTARARRARRVCAG
jgi:hypothetical protein